MKLQGNHAKMFGPRDNPVDQPLAMSTHPPVRAQQIARFRERYPTGESLFPEADSYILTGGCSMTAGAEMSDWAGDFEYLQCEFSNSTWPERIRESRHPDKTVFNTAQGGITNQHIARRMLHWMRKSRPTAAYVMWTSIQRVHWRSHTTVVAEPSISPYQDHLWYHSMTAGMLLEAENPKNAGKPLAGNGKKKSIYRTGSGPDYEAVLNLFETLEPHHLQLKFLHDDLYWRDYLRQYCRAEGIPLYETTAWEHKDAWRLIMGEEYKGSWDHFYYKERGKMDPYLDLLIHNEFHQTENVFNIEYRGEDPNNISRRGFFEWWKAKNGEFHSPGGHPVAQAHTEWAEEWCKWLQ